MPKRTHTYAAFALLGLLWGSNFTYMKRAATLISAGQITVLRIFFGFLPLVVMASLSGVIRRDQLRYLPHFLMMAAASTAFYYFAIVKGTALLPSGIAGVLGGSIALFTCIASLLLLPAERLNWWMALGVLTGFSGIVLIARPWEGGHGSADPAGVFWMLTAAAVLGLSYVYVRLFLTPAGLPPLALSTWQLGLALPMVLVLLDWRGIDAILSDGTIAVEVAVGLGILGTGAAFLIYYFLVRELGAVAASGATYITPVVALVIGWVGGEHLGRLEIAGSALILCSIVLLQLGRQRAARNVISGAPGLSRT